MHVTGHCLLPEQNIPSIMPTVLMVPILIFLLGEKTVNLSSMFDAAPFKIRSAAPRCDSAGRMSAY